MTNRKMRVMYIVVAGLFLVICIFLFGGGYMNKNNHTQEIDVNVTDEKDEVLPSTEVSEQIEIGNKICQIKNDENKVYSECEGEVRAIHKIKDKSTMSFFVSKIKGLEQLAVIVADPKGNGFENIQIYSHDTQKNDWKQIPISADGNLLLDGIFYGFARGSKEENLELAERLNIDNQGEFVIYQVEYNTDLGEVVLKEKERLSGGVPLWWTNS